MKFWKSRNKAFTLLECLVALLVISGSVLVIEGLSRLAAQEIRRSQDSAEKDWQIFCHQLRSELERAKFDKVENNFLYVTGATGLRFGSPRGASDFRKTNSDGRGYQPMLHDVKSVRISQNQRLVTINLQMTSGGEKQFLYKFSEDTNPENTAEGEFSSTP
ncbi:competence type IV pilus minor pilin ComGF [Lactovum odontotermitis]